MARPEIRILRTFGAGGVSREQPDKIKKHFFECGVFEPREYVWTASVESVTTACALTRAFRKCIMMIFNYVPDYYFFKIYALFGGVQKPFEIFSTSRILYYAALCACIAGTLCLTYNMCLPLQWIAPHQSGRWRHYFGTLPAGCILWKNLAKF